MDPFNSSLNRSTLAVQGSFPLVLSADRAESRTYAAAAATRIACRSIADLMTVQHARNQCRRRPRVVSENRSAAQQG